MGFWGGVLGLGLSRVEGLGLPRVEVESVGPLAMGLSCLGLRVEHFRVHGWSLHVLQGGWTCPCGGSKD